MTNSAPSSSCPRCGAPFPKDAPHGLCPPCMLFGAVDSGLGMDSPTVRIGGGSWSEPVAADHNLPIETIGPYRLLEKLGEGGFGVVWLAEQREPIKRRVALKEIKLGMDTREVIARFGAERQALALMEHPNIAKVLDAGATSAGRPYFVMELVRGMPVTKFCSEHKLGIRERLELFADICAAINHAHQKGIIHRDIKPSNILATLVGDKAVAKVIDFGIAKATQQKLTDATLFTRQDQLMGTPIYMSPEQVALTGIDIDTRSDIYSLGVLLYELLTGRPPFDYRTLSSGGYDEMRRIIREEEPLRPSTRVGTISPLESEMLASTQQTDPIKLRRQLRAGLDWIVMKAMEKDRARRYATADALAADIRRFLRDEPVEAAPPGNFYRLQKTIRRHRVAFGVGAAMFVLLTGGITVSTWQWREAVAQRNRAETENARVVALKDQQGDLLLALQGNLARELMKRKNLAGAEIVQEIATKHYARLPTEPFDVDQMRYRAAAVVLGGDIAMKKADPAKALQSYREALSVLEELHRRVPENHSVHHDLAVCHNNMGAAFTALQDAAAASSAFYKYHGMISALSAADPENTDHLQELALSWNLLGDGEAKKEPQAALETYGKAMTIWKRLTERDPANRHWQKGLINTYLRVGDLHRISGDIDGSASAWTKALNRQVVILSADQEDEGMQETTVKIGVKIAEVLPDVGLPLKPGIVSGLARAIELLQSMAQSGKLSELPATWLPRLQSAAATPPGAPEK